MPTQYIPLSLLARRHIWSNMKAKPLLLKLRSINKLLGLCCMRRLEADLIFRLRLRASVNTLPTLLSSICALQNMSLHTLTQQRTMRCATLEGQVETALWAMLTLLGEIKKIGTPPQPMSSFLPTPPFPGARESKRR